MILRQHPLPFAPAWALWFCLLCASLAGVAPASAQQQRELKGLALVIGQSDYTHLAALANPANDAEAVGSLLRRLGFEAMLVTDRDASRLRRDLDRFIEDAKGADVAILYYAGHGIEAGGENFLVPIDANLSALDAAGERLVPISAYVERLKATVPVTILMLDACRDNPFPADAPVRVTADAAPVAMGDAGLGETRGAARLGTAPAARESYGTVIAFAAEPGRAALDGAPGGNSPYTAAILRHFDAMAGQEFSVVMRMVAEEVYLKTSGRQQPWVNESLRKLLFFGERPAPLQGPEGDILSERRNLLLTISSLPAAERQQVEAVAREGDVPLDAIYAVLAALGQKAPSDPRDLERMLRDQAGRLRKMQEERLALSTSDAEITRLLSLAATAIGEGALMTAIELGEQAKARVASLADAVGEVEDQVRARKIEFAEVYARSAEAYELAADYERAAADYEAAFDFVHDVDAALASEYRLGQSWAIKNLGSQTGDIAAFEEAIELAREAADLAQDDPGYAYALRFLGESLQALGWSTDNAELIGEAIEVFREAATIDTREEAPEQWAEIQHSLGVSIEYLSWLDSGGEQARALLEEARDHYFAAMEVRTPETMKAEWAISASHAAVTLYRLAAIDGSFDLVEQSIDLAERAAHAVTREEDVSTWLNLREHLAGAYQVAGQLLADDDPDAAAGYYRLAIETILEAEGEEPDGPLSAANMLNNLGGTYYDLWVVSGEPDALESAEASYRDAYDLLEGLDADPLRKTAQEGIDVVAEARAGEE